MFQVPKTKHGGGKTRALLSPGLWLLCVLLGCSINLEGQQSVATAEGNSEISRSQQSPTKQSGRTSHGLIGYATDASFFFPDIATSPGPLTTAGKFELFVNQSISPPYVIVAGFGAAFDQARDVPEGYGQGWGAYGGRFGASMARASSSSFFGTFLFASLLHQDPRFFPQAHPSFWRSLRYSTERIAISRNDAGKDVFNVSGMAGPLAAEGLANVYLPDSERTVGRTLSRFAIDLGWRVAGNMFKDYWPTFFRNVGLNRLKIIPDPSDSPDQDSR